MDDGNRAAGKVSAEEAEAIRRELDAYRREVLARLGPEESAEKAGAAAIRPGGGAGARSDRARQLELLQAFFNSPSILDIRDAPLRTSSTREEVETRLRDLDYRIDLLQTMLTIFRQERELVDRALAAFEDDADGSGGENGGKPPRARPPQE